MRKVYFSYFFIYLFISFDWFWFLSLYLFLVYHRFGPSSFYWGWKVWVSSFYWGRKVWAFIFTSSNMWRNGFDVIFFVDCFLNQASWDGIWEQWYLLLKCTTKVYIRRIEHKDYDHKKKHTQEINLSVNRNI